MKIYVETTDKLRVKNLSTFRTDDCTFEVITDEPIDFSKIEGYVVYYNYDDGKNHLSFDPQSYQDYLDEQAQKEAMKKANQLLDELSFKTILENADADDALILKPLYPWWEIDKEYFMYERAQNGGKLYECIQKHTSDKDNAPAEPDGKDYWIEIEKSE